jgi:hypothetical protein
MEIPLLDIPQFLKGNVQIGTKLVSNLLRSAKLVHAKYECPKDAKKMADLFWEDVYKYNDMFYSFSEERKTSRYVLRTRKTDKQLLTCFNVRDDRIQIRTLQQRLADITTGFIISKLPDKTYEKMFRSFYQPMSRILEVYASLKGLDVPTDICLYYKGGNVFRILLQDVVTIIDNPNYVSVIKRSDADFSIFINPALGENRCDQIREEISVLSLYILYSLKSYLRNSRLLSVALKLDSLKEQYLSEIQKEGLKVKSVMVKTQMAARQDYVINKGEHNGEPFLMMQQKASILENIPVPSQSVFVISRNTSLDFKRKDNKRATFDLMRMKRNIDLELTMEDGSVNLVHVPFEVIDLSIPKGEDLALGNMRGKINTSIMQYSYNNLFTFRAPTLRYLLHDLHDLLFKQNEFPWYDGKYEKRITRFLISILIHEVLNKLQDKSGLRAALQEVNESFEVFIEYLRCILTGDACKYTRKKAYTSKLHKEHETLQRRINGLDGEDKANEIKHLRQFCQTEITMFAKLVSEVEGLINNLDAASEKEWSTLCNNLYQKGETRLV